MYDDKATTVARPLDRRRFLTTSLAAGIGAAILSAGELRTLAAEPQAAAGNAAAETRPSALPVRKFGKTGLRLPVLAMGGSAMVEKWRVTYGPQLPFERRVALVRHAFEAGIRYFDTSPNYGESEALLGEALHDIRDRVYLATKVGVPRSDNAILQPGAVRASLEKSLETLRTDHADCVQIHGPVFEYAGFTRAKAIYDELVKLREEKLFRYLGVTGHTAFETMYRLIDTGLFDQALIAYGYFPKGMDTILSPANLQWRERCLDRARELGMGVVAMKVLSSFLLGYRAPEIVPGFAAERLVRLRQAALRWVLRDERITLAVVGATRPDYIDQNVQTASADLALREEDRRLLADFSAAAYQSPIVKAMKVK